MLVRGEVEEIWVWFGEISAKRRGERVWEWCVVTGEMGEDKMVFPLIPSTELGLRKVNFNEGVSP